ncbi:carbohydrate binding domain-containing protein, partial [Streptomyces sp. NPDC059456]|uniref:carbohydrate binding domain-containing protein n=1 Tax=Streptomyces sp. NPDC059456 TaxID=3346838 RepID=UPI00368760D9
MRRRPARVTTLLTAAALAVAGFLAAGPPAAAADADLARNGGFEAGLDGWSCSAGSGAVVTTPVHGGRSALRATPAGQDNARCSQTVTVKPDSTYTLAAWVQGAYVYLGAAGTGTTDVSTWTQTPGAWKQLSTTFRTGAATTSVTVYTHGWYGQPAHFTDDVTLVGPDPGGSGPGQPQPPAAPTGLTASGATASSLDLTWSAAPGATSYALHRDSAAPVSVTGTSATVTGLGRGPPGHHPGRGRGGGRAGGPPPGGAGGAGARVVARE